MKQLNSVLQYTFSENATTTKNAFLVFLHCVHNIGMSPAEGKKTSLMHNAHEQPQRYENVIADSALQVEFIDFDGRI